MAALVFESGQRQRQQKLQQQQSRNSVDDCHEKKISVRCLLYLRDKNALIKQKLNRCQCSRSQRRRQRQRQQFVSTAPTAAAANRQTLRHWIYAATEIQQQLPPAACTKRQQQQQQQQDEDLTERTEAKTKTDTSLAHYFHRDDDAILEKMHKNQKLHYRYKNIVYKFGMNLKSNQCARISGTYFILKLTKLCLIIILLMSLLATATKIAQQVNCLELSKSLSATTQTDNNNNKNVEIMPTKIRKIESNMKMNLKNRTTTKIENETKNNNKKRATNSYSQFFFSYKNNDKRYFSSSSSSHSSFLSNYTKNARKSIKEIEIEQSERRYHRQRQQQRQRRALISTNTQREQSTRTTTSFDNGIPTNALPKPQSQRRHATTIAAYQGRRYHEHEHEVSSSSKADTAAKGIDIAQLTKFVMAGLGLKKLPDMQRVNISQQEYTSKYLEYLQRIQRQQEGGDNFLLNEFSPTLFTITVNSTLDITAKAKRWQLRRKRDVKDLFIRHRRRQRHSARGGQRGRNAGGGGDMTTILLKFPINDSVTQLRANGIEEANIRLMIMYSPSLAMKRNGNGKHQSRKRKPPPPPLENNENDLCMANVGNANAQMNHTTAKNVVRKKTTQSHLLNLKVFHNGFGNKKRKLLDTRKIRFESKESDIEDDTRSQWLDFDVTSAVRHWLEKNISNNTAQSLGLEVQCDNCKRIGARILNDVSQHVNDDSDEAASKFQLVPVLNIIGREIGLRQQMHAVAEDTTHVYGQQQTEAKYRKGNNCYKPHQRCCRRRLDIVFKEIKGFEFIIQPKVFDAGYCEGRCPPRHNPAHHHALLQSLIWKQDHKRAPRPCCAPSKLVKLEVLHVDEKDSDKLKISTWSDMQVIECACS